MTWTFLHTPWQLPLRAALHLFKFALRTVMLCFLEGKTIPPVTIQDENLCFHFKKIKRAVCLWCVWKAAGTTWSWQHLIYQRGWKQLTALRQHQQGTCREVTTKQPHGPVVSKTALSWPSAGLQRVCEKGCVPSGHCSLPFPFSTAPVWAQ